MSICVVGTILLRCFTPNFYKSGRGKKLIKKKLGKIAYPFSPEKVYDNTKIPCGSIGSLQYKISGRQIDKYESEFQIVISGRLTDCDIAKKQESIRWIESLLAENRHFIPDDALVKISVNSIKYKYESTIFILDGRHLKEFCTKQIG